MDTLRQRNLAQRKKNHRFSINISKMPKPRDPYTQQLQEDHFSFNHSIWPYPNTPFFKLKPKGFWSCLKNK